MHCELSYCGICHSEIREPGKYRGNKTRALLRPLRKTQENGEEYWCAAPAGSGLTPGEKVCWGEKHLVVLRGDGAFLGGKKLYDWAVLREEQGAFSGG